MKRYLVRWHEDPGCHIWHESVRRGRKAADALARELRALPGVYGVTVKVLE